MTSKSIFRLWGEGKQNDKQIPFSQMKTFCCCSLHLEEAQCIGKGAIALYFMPHSLSRSHTSPAVPGYLLLLIKRNILMRLKDLNLHFVFSLHWDISRGKGSWRSVLGGPETWFKRWCDEKRWTERKDGREITSTQTSEHISAPALLASNFIWQSQSTVKQNSGAARRQKPSQTFPTRRVLLIRFLLLWLSES